MNKEKIIIQIVVVPLKETFSQELPQMMSTSEKLRSKLMIENFEVPQPSPKKTNNFDQAKLFKKMQRQAHIAGLNGIGLNALQRKTLLKKILSGLEKIEEDTALITDLNDTQIAYIAYQLRFGKNSMNTKNLIIDNIQNMQKIPENIKSNKNVNSWRDIIKQQQSIINAAGKKDVIVNPKPRNVNNSNQNTSIWDILKAGSDFLQNFFEVEFVFTDMKNEKDKKFQRLMYTRVGSVEIPRLKNKTFTIKTASGTVSKIASKFEGGYETTLSIRPDQDCYIIDKLNEIGGNYEFSKPVVFAPSAIFNNDAMNYTKSHRLDIIVKDVSNFEHDYGQTFSDKIHKKGLSSKYDIVAVNSANVNLNRNFISEWRLEDVRIVGINDIEYSPDTTSPPDIRLQVIAKMVSHHYYSKIGTAVDFSIT